MASNGTFVGLLGAVIVSIAVVLVALHLYDRRSRRRLAAVLRGGAAYAETISGWTHGQIHPG